MKQSPRLDIQGLRALAVVAVVLFHLPAPISFRGGYVGVDMFFVISGFVVTNMVVNAENPVGHAWRSVGSFLRRRVMRLIPAASVVIVTTIVLAVIFAPTAELPSVSLAGEYSAGFVSNLFYGQNYATYWDPAVLSSPFLHTWSLGVEFQTYLVFPLVLLAVFRGVRSLSRQLANGLVAAGILSVLSLIAFIYFLVVRDAPFAGFQSGAIAFYSPVTRFWEFGLGILAAIVVSRYGWALRRPSRAVTVAAWVLIALGLIGCTIANQLSLAVIPSCVGVCLILANGARALGARPSLLAWRPFVWIGDRSYSIYLWHWPFLVLSLWIFPGNVGIAIGSLAVTVAVSMWSYRFIEQKFRRPLTRSPRTVLLPSLAFAVAAVLVAAAALGIGNQAWYATPTPLAAAAMSFPDAGVKGDQVIAAMKSCDVQTLTITCDNFAKAPTVVIIGDSLGYRSTPAVQLADLKNGYNTTMMWTGGCGLEVNSCPSWMYQYLAKTDVAAIIVNVNYDRPSPVIDGNEVAAGLDPLCPAEKPISSCTAHVSSVNTFTRLAAPGLKQLNAYSHHLFVALPFPQQKDLVATCLSPSLDERALGQVEAPQSCGRTSVDWQNQRQGLFPAAIRKATAADKYVTLWNPTSYLCIRGECPSVINHGDQIMQDAIHLTFAGSRLLYPAYSKFVSSLPASSRP